MQKGLIKSIRLSNTYIRSRFKTESNGIELYHFTHTSCDFPRNHFDECVNATIDEPSAIHLNKQFSEFDYPMRNHDLMFLHFSRL